MLSLISVNTMQWLARACTLIALFAACVTPALPAEPLACDMPSELIKPTDRLAHVADALTAKSALEVLALGSGSTVGDTGVASGAAMSYRAPGRSYPYRMIESLKAMRPTASFRLTVKGGRSMTADTMLPILRQELSTHHYDLVLWQTGTVEAVHGSRPDALRGALQDGADLTEAAGADLVLIDPQFSRFLRANTDLVPYQTVLQQVTGSPSVTMFHRFELTQAWVGSGQVDLERVGHEERDQTIGLLNDCLGHALAQYVLTGADDH